MKAEVTNYFNAFVKSFSQLKKNLKQAYVSNIDAKYAKLHKKSK